MLRRSAIRFLLLAAICWAPAFGQEPLHFPEPYGRVNDFAHILDAKTVSRLQKLSEEVDAKTHAQIAVVTVDTVGKGSINDYATALFNHWGIGHAGDNRGILILLAVSDHKWRIEVGRGLETLFPNARAAKIGATMVPDLKHEDYSKALWHTASEIAQILARDRGVELTSTAAGRPRALQQLPPKKIAETL